MSRFSEIPDIAERISRMEKLLSAEQRQRYESFNRWQTEARLEAQKLLDQRFLAFHAEQRKHTLTAQPHRLVRDRTAPREFRQAARELIAQQEIVAKLPAAQELERRDFLFKLSFEEVSMPEMAQTSEANAAGGPKSEHPSDTSALTGDQRAARMRERLEQARQTPSSPSRGEPGQD